MFQDILSVPFAAQWWVSLLFIWVFAWKGLALWKAARLGAKWWFVIILVVNTLGVLEILYIYVFSEKKMKLHMDMEPKPHDHDSESKSSHEDEKKEEKEEKREEREEEGAA